MCHKEGDDPWSVYLLTGVNFLCILCLDPQSNIKNKENYLFPKRVWVKVTLCLKVVYGDY